MNSVEKLIRICDKSITDDLLKSFIRDLIGSQADLLKTRKQYIAIDCVNCTYKDVFNKANSLSLKSVNIVEVIGFLFLTDNNLIPKKYGQSVILGSKPIKYDRLDLVGCVISLWKGKSKILISSHPIISTNRKGSLVESTWMGANLWVFEK